MTVWARTRTWARHHDHDRRTATVAPRRVRAARAVVIGACMLGALASGAGPVAHAAASPGRHTAGAHAARQVAPSPAAALGPLVNIPQTWNNCGPASIAEVLAYWGVQRTQGQVQAVLRPDGNPRGMMPYPVPAYVRGLGLRALLGVGGTEALVKALVSHGYPVIVSQQVSVSNRIGHYRPIEAYDDGTGVFMSSDPYMGANYRISYADFTRIWSRSGEGFMVLYPPSRQATLSSVLASVGWDRVRAYRHDLSVARARLLQPAAGHDNVAPQWDAHARGYGYLRLAWDELQLGHAAAARGYLRQAAQHGANPVDVGWISRSIASPAGA